MIISRPNGTSRHGTAARTLRMMMFCIVMSLIIATSYHSADAQPTPRRTDDIMLADALEPAYADRLPKHVDRRRLQVDVARGTYASVHVLLVNQTDSASDPVKLRVQHDGTPLDTFQWFQLISVPVPQNTGLQGYTEGKTGKNPYVIRKAPFEVYDVMRPITIDQPIFLSSGINAFRARVWFGPEATPGSYSYEICVERSGRSERLMFDVTVHEATVPPPGRDTLGYTNWYNDRKIQMDHNIDERWSEEHWQMLSRYFKLMVEGRQNMVQVPCLFSVQGDQLRLDRARLLRFVQASERAGLYWLEGPQLLQRAGGDHRAAEMQISGTDIMFSTPQGQRAFASILEQLMEMVREHGWEARWVQHITDEPTNRHLDAYRQAAAMIRQEMPGVPIFEASIQRQLKGAIDWWCPHINVFTQNHDFYRARQQAGEPVWIYTCCEPGGPWLNRLLDQERLRAVYLGWAAAKYDFAGFLHWGLNHHRGNPYTDTVTEVRPGGPLLPAGDTHIVYPGPNGPESSVRFEAHRVGLEDHELLTQLEQHQPAETRDIITHVLRSPRDFETSVAMYRKARRELLQAVSRYACHASTREAEVKNP